MPPEFRKYLRYAILMLVLVILQVTFIPLITVFRIQPSLPLIGIVFLTIIEGRVPGMLFAFPAGLMVDLYSGAVVGISALSLTIAAFAVGYFFDPERSTQLLRSSKVVVLVLIASLLSTSIFAFTYLQRLDIALWGIILRHVVGSSIYTTVLSTIPVLILARISPRLKV
jgi:rod shape-determining protein MreD